MNSEFKIEPRDDKTWQLRLIRDGEEVGGGIFPPGDDGYTEALELGHEWLSNEEELSA